MCGITGIYNLNGEPVPTELLGRMTEAMRHRGPDDSGLHVDGNFGMGSRRLSIIDLSPAGHMPMASEDQRLWISYNGEIYNYRELARERKAQGHRFRSDTDTEVALREFEALGPDCLSRFNGMFAFAIWDARRRSLFAARDRLGVKPFYYFFDGEVFAFASEIKPLLLHPRVRRRVNEEAVYDYLVFARTDHTQETFFQGIHRLPPAHWLAIDPEGRLRVERWWTVERSRLGSSGVNGNSRTAHGELRELLIDSIRLRLRSDVPIGTCLSGGLDSSSVVCITNRLVRDEAAVPAEVIGERQRTFSACYRDARFDERPFIETVAKHTGVECNYVYPDGNEKLWDEALDLIWHQEEPFTSTSVYAQWNVMRLAADRGVKVLLDGQGGDELMAGYPRYFATFLADLARRGRLATAWDEATSFRTTGQNRGYLLAVAGYVALPGHIRAWGEAFVARRRGGATLGVMTPAFASRWRQHRREHFAGRRSRYPRSLPVQLYEDTTVNTLPSLLRYEDKSSMAFSIEARVPFLDYRLVEYLLSLPAECHIHDGWSKWSLRAAMEGILPDAIRWRRDKKGFPTPEVEWLRAGRSRVLALFNGDEVRSRAFLDPARIRGQFDGSLDPKAIGITHAWRWTCLELWMRRFELS